jgi:aminoglycoside phosphotransferase (APT) family kinase protein
MTLDIEQPDALIRYLRQQQHITPDETPRITVLQGGVSNRTVLVERESGEAWVIKQALAKLRVQVDWFSPPERIHREAEGLRWLARLLPDHIPVFVFEDHDAHVLAMFAVPQPHENWKSMLLRGDLIEDHIIQFATLLATMHRRALEQRDEIAAAFADTSFFESLRLEPYYAYTATQVPEAAGFLQALIDDTRASRLTLVHGDYSPKNILVHRGKLVLLDYEVIHFGDPAFDLGFSLTHLLSKAHHLVNQRADFAAAAWRYWQAYVGSLNTLVGDVRAQHAAPLQDRTIALEIRAVRHTLACLLARVRGRSPLEYLSYKEQNRQCTAVLPLMRNPPRSIRELIDAFIEGL